LRLGDLTDERIAIQCHNNPDADADGIFETREGSVPDKSGDALLTGPDGESWPIEKERFSRCDFPMPGVGA
jgi:hypothetical protein